MYYISRITDTKTTTYRYHDTVDGKPVQKEIYDGECIEIPIKPNGDVDGKGDIINIRREPVYWWHGIAYTFDRTNKQALDRPTVTVSIPVSMLGITDLTTAAADFCLRQYKTFFDEFNTDYANKTRPDRENGKFIFPNLANKVMIRNTAFFADMPAMDYKEGKNNTIYFCKYIDLPPDIMCLHLRMEIQLPYLKLDRAKTMLLKNLPIATEKFINTFNKQALDDALLLEKTQTDIRKFLRNSPYCAFIANGSILARAKGSDAPAEHAVPFISPPEHEIDIAGIKGMGIKRGVTVITGGGYSGKSTVLNAISAGIYNHIAGDGRELCITDDTAVTITAEDGRAVSGVNVSPFIKWIPGGDTHDFSTPHASGSTSQGANIMEALACGSKLLLIDEDRTATNFMIRDGAMKQLIKKEPITPFTDRVHQIADMGTSTILVIGGSGEYLAVADCILLMDEYVMHEVTDTAKQLVPPQSTPTPHDHWRNERMLTSPFSTFPEGMTREALAVSDTGFIILGDERIDVRSLHDVVTPYQVNALAFILRALAKSEERVSDLERMALAMRGLKSTHAKQTQSVHIEDKVHALFEKIEAEGLNAVDTGFFTTMQRFMDMPRKFEVLAAINRMRHVTWTRR